MGMLRPRVQNLASLANSWRLQSYPHIAGRSKPPETITSCLKKRPGEFGSLSVMLRHLLHTGIMLLSFWMWFYPDELRWAACTWWNVNILGERTCPFPYASPQKYHIPGWCLIYKHSKLIAVHYSNNSNGLIWRGAHSRLFKHGSLPNSH